MGKYEFQYSKNALILSQFRQIFRIGYLKNEKNQLGLYDRSKPNCPLMNENGEFYLPCKLYNCAAVCNLY